MARNKFKAAINHIKSCEIQEKIQRLNEAPTNSIGGVYALNPSGFRLDGKIDPPKVFYPDVDGNWPDGVPGVDGEYSYTRPAGYWDNVGQSEIHTVTTVDFTSIPGGGYPNYLNTDQYIRASDGYVLSPLPPNSRDFILGPLIDAFIPNHYFDAYTRIGYIQKDTKQFVLLGRISGQWFSNANKNTSGTPWPNIPVWDGASTGFISYNDDFTLEHAQWFREQMIAGRYTENVPYYAAGGVGQSYRPFVDSNGQSYNSTFFAGFTPDDGKRGGPNDRIGTRQGDPNNGGPEDAGYPWGSIPDSQLTPQQRKRRSDYIRSLMNKAPGTHTPEEQNALMDAGLDDFVVGGRTQSPVGDLIQLAATAGLVFGAMKVGIGGILAGLNALRNTAGTYLTAKAISGGIEQVPGFVVNATTPSDYNKQLATKLPVSIISGQPLEIKLSNRGAQQQINSVDPQALQSILTVGGQVHKPSAQTTITPGKKTNLFGGTTGWGAQGGSEAHYDPQTDTLIITSEKTLRTTSGGQTVKTDADGRIRSFSDIPPADPGKVEDLTRKILNVPGVVDTAAFLGSSEYKKIQADPKYKEQVIQNVGQLANDLTTSGVQGVASNIVNLRQALVNTGIVPESDVEKIGGAYGQVYSQTKYTGDKIPPNIRNVINSKVGVNETYVLTESRKKVLREIKQPVSEIVESKPQKLKKYKPNFKGRFTAQNTPDVTACKESDNIVKAKNAAGQTWRTKDKHWSRYESQERMNIIYDHVGHGKIYWDEIVAHNQGKKGWRDRDIQEKLNMHQALLGERKIMEEQGIYEQETLNAPKDPLINRIRSKLSTQIDYPDKPSPMGYPDGPTPEQINGWHPEYGKRSDYFGKLDPISAKSMPKTGDQEIDAKVSLFKRISDNRKKSGKPNS